MNTTEHPRVIGIHGALEQHEIARNGLTQTLSGAASAGAVTDLLDLSELTLPLYNPDYSGAGDAVVVRRCVSQADAILLATWVRHDSYSAQLKTALEYCGTDEFANSPIGLLGVADGSGLTTALTQLRTICTTLDARVLPMQVSIGVDVTEKHGELPIDRITELRTLGQHVVNRISHTRE